MKNTTAPQPLTQQHTIWWTTTCIYECMCACVHVCVCERENVCVMNIHTLIHTYRVQTKCQENSFEKNTFILNMFI